MRWIDFKGKDPTQPLKDWKPWTKQEWREWKAEAAKLAAAVATLHVAAGQLLTQGRATDAAKKIEERNKLIDDNSSHWGKLKAWLFALSYGKCWFTEAKEIASHLDVEHFRPKKEARDLDGKVNDGYWWLAFDYTNFRGAGNVPNRKKGGWFPLASGCARSKYDQRCEESEQPLLLDPANPADPGLLAFDEEGNAIAMPGSDKWATDRVDESIKRLKLNDHDALPGERRRIWQETTTAINEFLDAKSKFDTRTNPAASVIIEEKARVIRNLTKAEAELSAVAQWCVLFRNDICLSRLVS